MLDVDTRPDSQSSLEYSVTPEHVANESTSAALARLALEDVAGWLAHSPNNPGYLSSQAYLVPKQWLDEHAGDIQERLTTGIDELTMDNVVIDLVHVAAIRDGNIPHINQKTGEIEHLSPTFAVTDFLNSGIKDIVEQASRLEAGTPTPEVNERSVQSIGAMLLRGVYFQKLSHDYPEEFTPAERDALLRLFQQNIVITIRRAARLTAEQPAESSAPVPAQQASEPAPITV